MANGSLWDLGQRNISDGRRLLRNAPLLLLESKSGEFSSEGAAGAVLWELGTILLYLCPKKVEGGREGVAIS